MPIFLSAQTSPKEIDSLIFRDALQLRRSAQYEKAIALSHKIIENSKKIGYQKGEVWGYVRQANALCSLGKFKESLEVLQKAKTLSESSDDFYLKSTISLETGRNNSAGR